MSNLKKPDLEKLLADAQRQHKRIIVDALVYDEKGKVFAQKRSPFRLKHPDCWDLPGGHLDSNENLLEGLYREVKEELSVEVQEVEALLDTVDFELDQSMLKDGEAASERIFQFLVKVKDVNGIKLEQGKAVGYGWFTREDADLTVENRSDINGKTYVRDAIVKALNYLETRDQSLSK